MNKIIDRINEAIDLEYDSQNQEIEELLKLPIGERVAKGDSIGALQANFKPLFQRNGKISFKTVEINCSVPNISKFREGNPVIFRNSNYQFELNVLEDNGKKMILQSGYHTYNIPESLQNSGGWQIDTAKVDIRNIVKKTSVRLSYDPTHRQFISRILEGEELPRFSENRKVHAQNLVEDFALNRTQKQAFINAYATENYFLIQGPPGSGKTWLLAHLAEAFAEEGKKVLITAPTHTAINNALQKTSTLTQHPHIIKVGKSNQKENLNYDGSTAKNSPGFQNSVYNNFSSGIIVGATCYSPCTKKLEFMDWDVVIFDEAAQLSVPLAVAAMARGKQFIFIGDHKQLPPIISEKQKDPVFSQSIFGLLHQYAPGMMLNVTYRMNKAINAFPSEKFYGGELQPAPANANRLLAIDDDFSEHHKLLDPMVPEVLYCHSHFSQDTRSAFEAQLAAECVSELLQKGVPGDEIALITPFRAQVRELKNAIGKIISDGLDGSAIFIDTIERIQGQERDVIILSMGASNPIKAKQRAEFFYNPNRLNVALTRARKKRIVIAHHEVFNLSTDDTDLLPLIQIFKDFKNSSTVISEWENVEHDLF